MQQSRHETGPETEDPARIGVASIVGWVFFGICLAVLDQWSKWAAFSFGQQANFGYFFRQENFLNERFAFSLPVPDPLMAAIYWSVLAGLLWHTAVRFSTWQSFEKAGAILVLAGGLSNVVERYWLGAVRDFLYLLGGVFNLADFFIFAGMSLLLTGAANHGHSRL